MADRTSSVAKFSLHYFLQRLYINIGKWHYLQWTLLCLSNIYTAFTSMAILVVGFQPKFRCFIPGNATNMSFASADYDDKCELEDPLSNQTVPCQHGYEYEGGNRVSFVAEWDLVCGKGYLAELSQTVYVAGMAVGATVISHIADRFGRKPLLLITGCGMTVSFGAVAFIQTYEWHVVMRFVQGFFNLGHYDVKIVLIMEMFPPRLRGTMIILDGLIWGIGVTILASLGYAFVGLEWRHVQLMMLPAFAIFIFYFFCIDESIRWLVANGKYKRAKVIIRKIGRMNGYKQEDEMTPEDKFFLGPDKYSSPETHPGEKLPGIGTEDGVVKYNLLDILKNRRSRNILIGMSFVWFTNSLIYHGLFLMTTAMSGERLLNVLLSAAVEIPAMAGLYVCQKWLGRRRGCVALHSTCALALFLAVAFTLTTDGHTYVVLMQIISVIGKFAISASFMLIYFYTPELLPTNFRTAGLGITSGAARFGSFLAPFSTFVFRSAPWAPGAVFGTVSLIAAVFLMFVPETREKELPQTLEDIELWFTDKPAKKGAMPRVH